jgi:hypothetical protein
MGEEKPLEKILEKRKTHEIFSMLEWFTDFISDEWGEKSSLHYGKELIINACWHGNLEFKASYDIGPEDLEYSTDEERKAFTEKQRALPKTSEFREREVSVLYLRYKDRVEIKVTQEGVAFEQEKFDGIINRTLAQKCRSVGGFSGEGLKMVNRNVDELYLEDDGMSVVMVKYLQ